MTILPRTLWYEKDDKRLTLGQTDLASRRESIVVLGEAGMGKTELMLWLGTRPGYSYVNAKRLKNGRGRVINAGGGETALAIDALDELTTRGEEDAVDTVVQRLGDCDYPRFVLACRAADWRNSTAVSALEDFYGKDGVLVVHLNPLEDSDVHQLLAEQLGDATRAQEVIAHFENAQLPGLLRNPQTLNLIAIVARQGTLPITKGALFERAVEELRREQREDKVAVQPDSEGALDAAGAAFASLILTGSDAVAVGIADPDDGELPVAELAALPGAVELKAVLGTRLFATAGSGGRFTYWHRRIGEFLGSRWLAKQAHTAMKRKRLIALFRSHGLVPASLRGIHAWLSYHDPALAAEVIAVDPLGVIEYGDADSFDPPRANALLDALEGASSRGLHIDDLKQQEARCLAAPALLKRVRTIINAPTIDFVQGLVVLEGLKGAATDASLRDDLRRLMLRPGAIWAHRMSALAALMHDGSERWQAHVQIMLDTGSAAWQIMEVVTDIGLDAFDDKFLVRCIVEHALSERVSVSMLMDFEQALPPTRLEGILDELAVQLQALPAEKKTDASMDGVNSFGFELIARVFDRSPVEPERLWRWLTPLRSEFGYREEGHPKILALLQANTTLRRALQRIVLFEEPSGRSMQEKLRRLTRRSGGLVLSEADIVWFLDSMGPSGLDDEVWRSILRETPHDETKGVAAREVAKRLVAGREDMVAWIDKLASPDKPEWHLRQERRQRQEAAKQELEWRQQREDAAPKIDGMRRGEFSAIINPARGYMGLFSGLPVELTPFERLVHWMGADLAEAAVEGFDAFMRSQVIITAKMVAEAHAESKRSEAQYIIVAALAERLRTAKPLSDISDDVLTIGFYETRHGFLKMQANIHGLDDAVVAEVGKRNLLAGALRAWIEPQLLRRSQHADGLHEFLWNGDEENATTTAQDWLAHFPEMAESPELDIIHRLIESRRFETLKATAATRLTESLSEGRRRNWQAVQFLIDFEATQGALEAAALADPALLFAIRTVVRRRKDEAVLRLGVSQLAFVVSKFRGAWPWSKRPEGLSMGDKNPYDATEFIFGLMIRLTDITSDDALSTVKRLIEDEGDPYSDNLRQLSAEQQRKLAEERYVPPELAQIRSVVEAGPPRSVADLQATLLVLLEQVQKRAWADPVDSWRGFYQDDLKTPHDEERCRDHLLLMLGVLPEGIDLQPEGHMAADKEADIIANIASMRLPVEIKGQWHKALWTAADAQLDRLYASDYAAERLGIYLVLWFGIGSPKPLRSPGKGKAAPTTPDELRLALVDGSVAAKSGRVEVVVLDLERPPRIIRSRMPATVMS